MPHLLVGDHEHPARRGRSARRGLGLDEVGVAGPPFVRCRARRGRGCQRAQYAAPPSPRPVRQGRPTIRPAVVTVRSREGSCSSSATRGELVTTVRSATLRSPWATAKAVVPAEIAIEGAGGDRRLLDRVHLRLDLEAGLVRAPSDGGGAAVDLADQSLLGERLVGDAEDLHELEHPRAAMAVDLSAGSTLSRASTTSPSGGSAATISGARPNIFEHSSSGPARRPVAGGPRRAPGAPPAGDL